MSAASSTLSATTSATAAVVSATGSSQSAGVASASATNHVAVTVLSRAERIAELATKDAKKLSQMLRRAKESGNADKIAEIEAARAIRHAKHEKATGEKVGSNGHAAASAAASEPSGSAKSDEGKAGSKSTEKAEGKKGDSSAKQKVGGSAANSAPSEFSFASRMGTFASLADKTFRAMGIHQPKIELLADLAKSYNKSQFDALKAFFPDLSKSELDALYEIELKKRFRESPELLAGTLHYATQMGLQETLRVCKEVQQGK